MSILDVQWYLPPPLYASVNYTSKAVLTLSASSFALRLASWMSLRFSIGGVRGTVTAVRVEAFTAASDSSHLRRQIR